MPDHKMELIPSDWENATEFPTRASLAPIFRYFEARLPWQQWPKCYSLDPDERCRWYMVDQKCRPYIVKGGESYA